MGKRGGGGGITTSSRVIRRWDLAAWQRVPYETETVDPTSGGFTVWPGSKLEDMKI